MSRKRCLVALIFWCIASLGTASAHEVRLPETLEEMTLMQAAEGVYVVHGIQALPNSENKAFMSNSGLVETEYGWVLFDTGGSPEVAGRIIELARGVSEKPIVAVFNSHVHGDHWLGNAAIREKYPQVEIFAHTKAIARLRAGDAEMWRGTMAGMMEIPSESLPFVIPDKSLEGSEVLEIGGVTMRIHHTGHAHTDSDIMLEVSGRRILFAGDVIEHGRAVSSDVPSDFDAMGQIAAIDHALELPVEIFVPGHGPTGGREIAEDAKRFLETLYGSVEKHYDEGLLDYEMRDQVAEDLEEFSDWFNFDDLGRLISYVYQQVEFADF
jgi:glyoxylase-like metal-dependent hydrolase (beta-lactamase superfamily II)